MIETKPWPGHPEEGGLPPDARTMELTLEEVTEALSSYLALKGYGFSNNRCFVQFKTETGLGKHEIFVRYTYWKNP